MDIKEMQYIVAIAEEKTLSKAAKRLGVSQPTLTSFLYNLEDELGVDLFTREKKKFIPTEAGQIYLSSALRIISIHDQTYSSIHHLNHSEKKTIRIAGTPLRGAMMIASISPAFHRKYPHTKLEFIECYTSDIKDYIRKGKADIGINAFLENDRQEFTCVTNAREEIILAVPSFYPIAEKVNTEYASHIRLKDFNDLPYILMSQGSNQRTIVDKLFEEEGITPTIIYESKNNAIIRSMIQKGGGIGFYARTFIQKNADVVYFSLDPKLYLNLGFLLKKNKKLTDEILYLSYLTSQLNRSEEGYIEPLDDPIYCSTKEKYGSELVYLSE